MAYGIVSLPKRHDHGKAGKCNADGRQQNETKETANPRGLVAEGVIELLELQIVDDHGLLDVFLAVAF